jgi:hypothetical protein
MHRSEAGRRKQTTKHDPCACPRMTFALYIPACVRSRQSADNGGQRSETPAGARRGLASARSSDTRNHNTPAAVDHPHRSAPMCQSPTLTRIFNCRALPRHLQCATVCCPCRAPRPYQEDSPAARGWETHRRTTRQLLPEAYLAVRRTLSQYKRHKTIWPTPVRDLNFGYTRGSRVSSTVVSRALDEWLSEMTW